MLPLAGGRGRRILLPWGPLLLVFLASAPHAFAADASWDGSMSTAWGTKQNWSTNKVPTSTDNAKFSGTFTNQPTLGATAETVGGIWMTTGVGQNVTIGGTATLTLASNTINGTAGLGILVDNTSSFTLTINCPLAISATQTWTNTSSNLLTVGAINLSTFGLTVNGTGSTSVTGIVSGTGTITKSGTGTLTLSGTNTYTGSTTVSAGILNVQNASGLGTTAVGTTVSSGATLQLQGGITIGTEALAISGTGAAGQNGALVNVSGTNNYGGLLTLGAATTISSDSGTLNLTNTGTITGATFGLTLTGAGSGSLSSIIGTTSGTLTKSGSGTWTLSGASTYTGTTTVTNGTLQIDNNDTTTARLGGTTGITINSGGTLLLTQSGGTASTDRINNSATMTLNGGTFNTGGLSEHGASNNTAGIGALTLQASSIINMGSGSSIIAFADSHLASWTGTLKIYNWSGTQSGGGTDQLYFGSDATGLTAGQLSEINIYSDSGTTLLGVATILADGEIVPVPEPSTYLAAALAVLATFYFQRRRIRFTWNAFWSR